MLNKNVDVIIQGISYFNFVSYGDIIIGESGFEYYNKKNIQDYIQIPWNEVEYIEATVIFRNKITRFNIVTKKDGSFSFSSKDNKKILRAINKYIDSNKLLKANSFIDILIKKIKGKF